MPTCQFPTWPHVGDDNPNVTANFLLEKHLYKKNDSTETPAPYMGFTKGTTTPPPRYRELAARKAIVEKDQRCQNAGALRGIHDGGRREGIDSANLEGLGGNANNRRSRCPMWVSR